MDGGSGGRRALPQTGSVQLVGTRDGPAYLVLSQAGGPGPRHAGAEPAAAAAAALSLPPCKRTMAPPRAGGHAGSPRLTQRGPAAGGGCAAMRRRPAPAARRPFPVQANRAPAAAQPLIDALEATVAAAPVALGPPAIQIQSFTGQVPQLVHYAEHGDYDSAKLLLDQGEDPDQRDDLGFSALHVAAKRGHGDVVSLLLERGASANVGSQGSGGGDTPLHYACKYGRVAIVKVLLRYGADPHLSSREGKTCRDYAEAKGHAAVLNELPS